VLIADGLSRRITCQSASPILNPPIQSRNREIPPFHHPAIEQSRTIAIVNPKISNPFHPDPQSLHPQLSM